MLTVLPVSLQNAPILPLVLTIAVFQIILPLSKVLTAIAVSELTLAMSLVVLKVPFVLASAVCIVNTGICTNLFIVFPWTYVGCSIRPGVSTASMLLIVHPITIVCDSLALVLPPRHFALSMPHVVFPLACILAASISVCENTFARLFAIHPVAIVKSPCSPSQFASSMKLVILEQPFIFASTIRKGVFALALPLIFNPVSCITR